MSTLTISSKVPTIPSVVHILTPTFFDLNGTNMFYGGAERYVIELVRLIHEMGFEAQVFQAGTGDWVRHYQDVRVIGIDVHGEVEKLSQEYHRRKIPAALVIYSPFSLATREAPENSIGISHGIFWDLPGYKPRIPWLRHPFRNINLLRAISRLAVLVSVDTNTINWIRAADYNEARRCVYIPNFVDTAVFRPKPRKDPDHDRLVILYPRRLYPPRGFGLVAQILPDFLAVHPKVDFHFVGKANPAEATQVQELIKQYPDRVRWYHLPPEKMQSAYQEADIALIPTIHSEGTSLSCLEALASGNAVIATNVGGLPDLVIDGYNGLLIEPDADALRKALDQLVDDAALRARLSSNGAAVAQAFDLGRWRERWRQLLQARLSGFTPGPVWSPLRCAVFPAAAGADGAEADPWIQKLARTLAELGMDTYIFRNDPGKSTSDGRIHYLVSGKDELFLKHPLLVLTHPGQYGAVAHFTEPVILYFIPADFQKPIETLALDDRLAAHRQLLERADILMVSTPELAQALQASNRQVIFAPEGCSQADLVISFRSQTIFRT